MESRVLSRATAFSSLPRLPNKLPRQPPNASFLPLKTTIADGSCGVNQLSTNWGSTQLLPVLSSPAPRREAVRIKPCSAAATSSAAESSDSGGGNVVVATFFFFTWFILNLVFNILNKTIFNYFPYPYFVSAIQLFVGVVYSLLSWAVGLPKPARIDSRLVMMLIPVAVFHALGHVASNVSFASVAISFTHTIKALEPFFNVAASQFILGQSVPITLWLSLAPVVIGVSVASLTELSFNRIGLISAMISNISVTFRSIYSKKAMTEMDSTNVYAYITIIALFVCIPPAIIVEGPALLNHGINDAIAKVGLVKFVSDLFLVGISYHLYNKVATNTLERVPPLTNAFGNVLKRVSVIGLSILFFGTTISNQTAIGTAVAISGVALYSFIKAKIEEDKRQGKA